MSESFGMHVGPSADKFSWCALPQRVVSTVLHEHLLAPRTQEARVCVLASASTVSTPPCPGRVPHYRTAPLRVQVVGCHQKL